MIEKQKQEVSLDALEFSKIDEIDSSPDAWNFLNQDNVEAYDNIKEKDNQQKIEKLYPEFKRKEIPLEKLIPADEKWNFFPKQNKNAMIDLMKNIAAYGQLSPAIVWQQPDGMYMILGGHNRYAAIKKLNDIFKKANDEEQAKKFSKLDCNAYDYEELNEIDARKIIIYDNIIRRENTTTIKARAVINMAQLEHESREKHIPTQRRERVLSIVAKAIGETEGTVKKLYQLRNLIPGFWDLINSQDPNQKITVQFARTVALLDKLLQEYILVNELYKIKISANKLNMLKTASTFEQIDEIFKEEDTRTFSNKIEIKNAPNDCDSFILVCQRDDTAKIKELIERYLCKSEEISEQTKNILMQIINNNRG